MISISNKISRKFIVYELRSFQRCIRPQEIACNKISVESIPTVWRYWHGSQNGKRPNMRHVYDKHLLGFVPNQHLEEKIFHTWPPLHEINDAKKKSTFSPGCNCLSSWSAVFGFLHGSDIRQAACPTLSNPVQPCPTLSNPRALPHIQCWPHLPSWEIVSLLLSVSNIFCSNFPKNGLLICSWYNSIQGESHHH